MNGPAVITTEPLASVGPGDVVAFARPGERAPLFRRIVSASSSWAIRPETNTPDLLVAVTIAHHPRRHAPSSPADVVTGWASDSTIDVVHFTPEQPAPAEPEPAK